ncbi:MAG: bile acid:sodium symporter family protein [Clostridia bacterium]|nr:bile acid:sodium symporter family protein [Clostridia bacterium]
MKVRERISAFVGKYMAFIVLAVAALSLFVPRAALWVQTCWVNYLLMIVMFGMGLTLKIEDFRYILKHPGTIGLGCVSQFTIMPLLAFGLGSLFQLDDALLAGVILVGTCPGGTASNVITYLAKGDVALSVGMTSVNTLLAPVLTPAITYLFLHTTVQVNVWSMFLSIIQVVIVPIALGLVINHFLRRFTESFARVLPLISVAAICLIVMAVVSHNAGQILTAGPVILAVVVLHNLLGYACGFGLGKLLKLDPPKTKALSIEIGMQNSGLATSLAGTAFPNLAMATVPGAVFSVWHNISGAVLANLYRRKERNPSCQE